MAERTDQVTTVPRPRTDLSVPAECDLVMEGGVTSAVVYPPFVCEIAAHYRLRQVGGTSAGAIAAAAAASAQLGELRKPARISGRPGGDCWPTGFAGLRKLTSELARDGDRAPLLGLFTPDGRTAPTFAIARAALVGGSRGRLRRVLREMARYLWRHQKTDLLWVILAALGSALSLGFAAAIATRFEPFQISFPVALLAVTALSLAIAITVAIRPRRRPIVMLHSLAALMLASAVVMLALVILLVDDPLSLLGEEHVFAAAVTAFVLLGALSTAALLIVGPLVKGARAVERNLFGLVSGLVGSVPDPDDAPTTGRPDLERHGLTEYLTLLYDRLAGLEPGGDHLTFGDLWRGDERGDGPGQGTTRAPGGSVNPSRRAVDLQLVTTCVSLGRPFTFPHVPEADLPVGPGPDLGSGFLWSPADFRRLFPASVVAQMAARVDDGDVVEREGRRYLPLPGPEDLPVIVGVRMSLAFPLLLSAVPLYRLASAADGGLAHDDRGELVRLWFSDGGISSNFPIHLFDSACPTRPTFAINLTTAVGAERSPWLSSDSTRGLWRDFGFQHVRERQGLRSTLSFLMAAFTSARTWRDTTQGMLRGYRDRIVHLPQGPGEGGLNLAMSAEVIGELASRGERAGRLLVDHFSQGPDADQHWRGHQGERVRNALRALAYSSHAFAYDISRLPAEAARGLQLDLDATGVAGEGAVEGLRRAAILLSGGPQGFPPLPEPAATPSRDRLKEEPTPAWRQVARF